MRSRNEPEPLTTADLMGLADSLAQDLLELSERKQISEKDLIMSLTIAQRLLQVVLYPDNPELETATAEADATFTAITGNLRAN